LEVIEEIKSEINGKPPVERVWDEKILQQQKTIRGAWLGAAPQCPRSTPKGTKSRLG